MDEILFGSYEQGKGQQPILWQILDRKDGRILITSKYALDAKPYNTAWEDVTWETSSIRAWLNGEFLDGAFTPEERERILELPVAAEPNPNSSVQPGRDTVDRVFFLSVGEAEKYYKTDKARACEPTEYSARKGVYINGSNGCCWWWLRSPGIKSNYAAHVSTFGGNYHDGCNANVGNGAVRPSMWIRI